MSRPLLLICLAVLLAACGQPPVVQLATAAPTPTSPARPEPTTAATISPTVAPSATATSTPTPIPTATATAMPTNTPEPTVASTATVEPRPATLTYVFPLRAKRYGISSSHHDYPAADITCPIGSEFVAVTSGVVDFVSREDLWMAATDNPADRGGLSVAIVGDDGVRYYGSHLSEIAEGIEPGVRVEAGHLLGLTGDTGNARGTDPHLHFGLSHPTTPDDWKTRRGEIWPQKYLRAWARGEQMTPKLP